MYKILPKTKMGSGIKVIVPATAGAAILASLATGSYLWFLVPAIVAGASLFPVLPRTSNNYSSIAMFNVRLKKGQEDKLASIVSSRSQTEAVVYTVVSTVEAGRSSIIVAILSSDSEKVRLESEVFRSLVSSLIPGASIERVEAADVAEAIKAIVSSNTIVGLEQGSGLSIPIITGEKTRSRGIELGYRLDGLGRVALTIDDIKGHIGVFGSTGMGKSTTLSIIAEGASKIGLRTVILDWTGEYSSLLASRGVDHVVVDPLSQDFSINPFKLGLEIDVVANILSSALSLTEPQEYMLMKVLKGSKVTSIGELEALIESLPEEAKWDREVKRGLLRKIGPLTLNSGARLFTGVPKEPSGDLIVVDASRISNAHARRLYIMLYLALSFYNAEGQKLIIIDEAHNVLGSGESILSRMLAESRKYGAYIALATQSPASIDNSVILNTNTKIVHALRSYRDRELIADSIGMTRDESEILAKLSPGEAVVFAPSIGFPVLVSIDSSQPA